MSKPDTSDGVLTIMAFVLGFGVGLGLLLPVSNCRSQESCYVACGEPAAAECIRACRDAKETPDAKE